MTRLFSAAIAAAYKLLRGSVLRAPRSHCSGLAYSPAKENATKLSLVLGLSQELSVLQLWNLPNPSPSWHPCLDFTLGRGVNKTDKMNTQCVKHEIYCTGRGVSDKS